MFLVSSTSWMFNLKDCELNFGYPVENKNYNCGCYLNQIQSNCLWPYCQWTHTEQCLPVFSIFQSVISLFLL